MKKGLIFLLGIMSILGVNTVSADTGTIISHFYTYFDDYVDDYNQYKENIDTLVNYWQENYSNSLPYYAVIESLNGGYASSTSPTFYLCASSSNKVSYISGLDFTLTSQTCFEYDSTTDKYNYSITSSPSLFGLNIGSGFYYEHQTLISNGLKYDNDTDFLLPTFYSTKHNLTIQEIKLLKGINYPTIMDLYNGTYDYNINELAPDLELEDVISSPLDALTKVKDTIVNIFNTISDFITLLPDTMQTFLYLSFSVAIILGLLKIIL